MSSPILLVSYIKSRLEAESSVFVSKYQWSSLVVSDCHQSSEVDSGCQRFSAVFSGCQQLSAVVSGLQWSAVVMRQESSMVVSGLHQLPVIVNCHMQLSGSHQVAIRQPSSLHSLVDRKAFQSCFIYFLQISLRL